MFPDWQALAYTNLVTQLLTIVYCHFAIFSASDSSSSDPVMVGPRSALLSLSPPSPYPLSLYAFSNCLQYISVFAGNTEGGWVSLWGL
ncbi:uncharacterized [Tachysurus ichikawai]